MATTRVYCFRRTILQLRHYSSLQNRLFPSNSLQSKCYYYRYSKNNDLYRRFLSTLNGDATADGQQRHINLSDKCVKQLKKITADDKDKETFLRVLVEGGGCSGFQYLFKLDTKKQDDDRVFEKGGVKVVVDESSLEIIDGSTIDYQEELIRSAFSVIDNPKAVMGCSCGVSFSLKI